MWTYRTVDGRILNLTAISAEERAYLAECEAAYRLGTAWDVFNVLAEGAASPLVRAAGGQVTRAVWDHPVFQAARDMEDRLGIAQGYVGSEPDLDLTSDPFADEWLPATAAAARVGVTLAGLHKAIARGEIIARPAKPGGTRLVVSVNSLARWTPSRVRQAAGRKSRSGRVASRAAGEAPVGVTPAEAAATIRARLGANGRTAGDRTALVRDDRER